MLPNMDFIRVFSKSEIKDDARNYAVNQGDPSLIDLIVVRLTVFN